MNDTDVLRVLKTGLAKDRRPSDGLLHCSSDLIGSLRHAQLACAGAPRIESELVSDIRLRTGTMWHSYFNELLIGAGKTVMHEVKVTPWLPDGWSGTADWLTWVPDKRAFTLDDLKTTRGEGMRWVDKEGIKEEHHWQLSAYYHALAAGGFPLIKRVRVLYLPMNAVSREDVEPTFVEAEPLDKDLVWGVMEDRWAKTNEYLTSLKALDDDERWDILPRDGDVRDHWQYFLTRMFAPPLEREQRLYLDKKTGVVELKLVPHWSTRYCPYPNELCNCSEQGTTKIGQWGKAGYSPRKGYESIEPQLSP